jgi:uncharacterized protein YaiL (DUF2058 family)
MQNLRDKLMKAGLVTEGDARRVESEPRRPARNRSEAPIPKLPPLPVPNNKEFQRLEAKRQLELDRQIRELVQGAQVEPPPGTHTFYFVTRKNRLRRMLLTPELAARLEKGELAVVERPDPGQIEHAIVPADIAERLLSLSEKSVRFFNKPGAAVGFISDAELGQRQKAEAEQGPEAEDEPAAPSPEESPGQSG